MTRHNNQEQKEQQEIIVCVYLCWPNNNRIARLDHYSAGQTEYNKNLMKGGGNKKSGVYKEKEKNKNAESTFMVVLQPQGAPMEKL